MRNRVNNSCKSSNIQKSFEKKHNKPCFCNTNIFKNPHSLQNWKRI